MVGGGVHYNMIYIAVILSIQININALSAAEKGPPFHSRDAKEGHFTSPEYPYSFQSSQNMTYKFTGEYKERVQIIFDEFKLFKPDPNEVYTCGKRNAYLNYKKSEGTIVYLCGPQKPLPILSDTNIFFLEYRQPLRNSYFRNQFQEDNRGFNATYRFVKNYGIDSGRQMSEGCEFSFDSTDANNGTFQSPNFNGYYPENMECIYYFRGTEKYLKINFTHFNLLGSTSCSEVYGGDFIEMSETTDRDMNFFYERHCGQLESFNRTVNGTAFYVIFKSFKDHVTDSKFTADRPFVGFKAYYEFTNDTSNAFSLQIDGRFLPFSYMSLVYSLLLSTSSFTW